MVGQLAMKGERDSKTEKNRIQEGFMYQIHDRRPQPHLSPSFSSSPLVSIGLHGASSLLRRVLLFLPPALPPPLLRPQPPSGARTLSRGDRGEKRAATRFLGRADGANVSITQIGSGTSAFSTTTTALITHTLWKNRAATTHATQTTPSSNTFTTARPTTPP